MRVLGWSVWGLIFLFTLITTWNIKRDDADLPEHIRHSRPYRAATGGFAWLWVLLILAVPNGFNRIHLLWAAPVVFVISSIMQLSRNRLLAVCAAFPLRVMVKLLRITL